MWWLNLLISLIACFNAVLGTANIHPGITKEKFTKHNLHSLIEWAVNLKFEVEDTQSSPAAHIQIPEPSVTPWQNSFQQHQVRKHHEMTQRHDEKLDALATMAVIQLENTAFSQKKRMLNYLEHSHAEPPLKSRKSKNAKGMKSVKSQFFNGVDDLTKISVDTSDNQFEESRENELVTACDDSDTDNSLVSENSNEIFAYFTYEESLGKSIKKDFSYRIGTKLNTVRLEISTAATNLRNLKSIKDKISKALKTTLPQHRDKSFRVKVEFESDRDFISASHFLNRLRNSEILKGEIDFGSKKIKIIIMANMESAKIVKSFKIGDKNIKLEFRNIKDNTLVIHDP